MDATAILVGVIGRPHGVRGLVHVTSYTDDPDALACYAPLTDAAGRQWRLDWHGAGIAALIGADGARVADRDAAARLTNTALYVPRDRLPAPAADEFYLADLVGLAAEDEAGAALGRVAQVHDFGAGASLEITREGAPALLVPFTRRAVPTVDLAGGRVIVAPPAEIEARDPPA